ncbi:hypothetical protein A5630_25240 [Mycolicibacterium mucogenicum]|uniref:Uncharacterized protein n=1 Tax=Mycolicibacterium mucogenicum TaxID=56689 RepID=A0A1A3GY03_MYCMU|nr:hypothetical protein [Mycolicibacterium mucogenicum]OBJ40258.1 hypothetical protein A5630_25240 [Mycolicibacterium mucogenicum]
MDTEEFLDVMYQGWAKTVGAEDRFYVVGEPHTVEEWWPVYAVDKEDNRVKVATFLTEHDADWFASLHGAFPDLIRQVRTAMDEASNLDYRVDELTCRIAELEMEAAELERELNK